MSSGPASFEDWRPPEGWLGLDSAVDGIAIYGPPPQDSEADGPTLTRCPQCGAASQFQVSAGTLACTFCGWADQSKVEQVGREAPAGEFTPEALRAGLQGFGVDRRELGCTQCGATIAVDVGALSASCPFCASNQVNVREHATVSGIRPGSLIRFAVEPARNAALVREWLGRGWMHPSDLQDVAAVERFSGIYLPWWAFSADVHAEWRAQVGTQRTESYRDSNGNWRTRTVIDWHWRNGEVGLSARDVRITGTTKVSARLLERVDDYEPDALVSYEPALLAGWQALTYDVGLPDAWESGRAEIRERARVACRRDTGSSHVRNLSLSADLDDESWRHLLLPVYVSAFRFEGRTFVVLVNGQTGTVAGQKPVAWWKVWTAIALMWSPAALGVLIGLPLLLVGVGAVVLGLALFAAIAAGIGSWWVYQQAVESEAP